MLESDTDIPGDVKEQLQMAVVEQLVGQLRSHFRISSQKEPAPPSLPLQATKYTLSDYADANISLHGDVEKILDFLNENGFYPSFFEAPYKRPDLMSKLCGNSRFPIPTKNNGILTTGICFHFLQGGDCVCQVLLTSAQSLEFLRAIGAAGLDPLGGQLWSPALVLQTFGNDGKRVLKLLLDAAMSMIRTALNGLFKLFDLAYVKKEFVHIWKHYSAPLLQAVGGDETAVVGVEGEDPATYAAMCVKFVLQMLKINMHAIIPVPGVREACLTALVLLEPAIAISVIKTAASVREAIEGSTGGITQGQIMLKPPNMQDNLMSQLPTIVARGDDHVTGSEVTVRDGVLENSPPPRAASQFPI